VINSVKSAKKITGIKNVYAIIGGFHLSGKIYEDIIDPTLDELVKLDARFIVPCHCTGWKAVNKIVQSVRDSFIQSSVGSKFLFFGAKRKLQIVNQNLELTAIELPNIYTCSNQSARLRAC
jgi:7,8-dihydropterin-6-yl-methyl-4-(beta-D-ribofuranosyl)aminobenzene 5'-phosphate synthase